MQREGECRRAECSGQAEASPDQNRSEQRRKKKERGSGELRRAAAKEEHTAESTRLGKNRVEIKKKKKFHSRDHLFG